ncbi:MAG: hypothetical protein ABEK59_11040 [Halobacteria archaeon]
MAVTLVSAPALAQSDGGVGEGESVEQEVGGKLSPISINTCLRSASGIRSKMPYGPTNVNAELGNQNLTVDLTRNGTVSVFKYPNPSYYEQIKYRTRNISKPFMGARPNAGSFLGLIIDEGNEDIGETGSLDITANSGASGEWQKIKMDGSYDNPVVIARPDHKKKPVKAHVRVRDVKSDSFEIQLEGWPQQSGKPAKGKVNYMVLESGTHMLSNGEKVSVGSTKVGIPRIGSPWKDVNLGISFTDRPLVFAQSQTYNTGNIFSDKSDPVVTRIRNVSNRSFETRITQADKKNHHVKEQVGYIAMKTGKGELGDTRFDARKVDRVRSGNWTNVTFSPPYEGGVGLVAEMQTDHGPGGAELRYNNLSGEGVDLEVERADDAQSSGQSEEVGLLTFERTGRITGEDTSTVYLRNMSSTQTYVDKLSDTLRTTYVSKDHGLKVNVTDVIPSDKNVFSREVEVKKLMGSDVQDVSVVAFENFNLVASKFVLSPTRSWCNEGINYDAAQYDSDFDGIVHSLTNTSNNVDIVTSMAFDGKTNQHQVGGDAWASQEPIRLAIPGGGVNFNWIQWGEPGQNDAYMDSMDGVLNGSDKFSGQTTGALTRELDLSDGTDSATVHLAAAKSEDEVKNIVRDARSKNVEQVRKNKKEWFNKRIGDAPLPDTDNKNVTALSRRALVTVVQNWNPESNSLVASAATQSPYGGDWIRDGSYFNYFIDRVMGNHDMVRQHNKFYQGTQKKSNSSNPWSKPKIWYNKVLVDIWSQTGPVKPFKAVIDSWYSYPGTWVINYYSDKQPAGPIWFEIDEAGYGPWTFYDHYKVTGNESYLQEVYPEIKRTGDFLVKWRSDNGLQKPASEDDHVQPEQSFTGGAPVHLGLDSAANAAREMAEITGKQSYMEDYRKYTERREELGKAIDNNYWKPYQGNNRNLSSYGGGNPKAVMPTCIKPLDNPKMQQQYEVMWENKVKPTVEGEKKMGQYESKSLIGLAKGWKGTDNMSRVKRGLHWVADNAASKDTHILGEAWIRWDGRVRPQVSQPHAWEQILFYMAALETYPSNEKVENRMSICRNKWANRDPEITSASVSSGEYSPGDKVETMVDLVNNGSEKQTYYVTYSVEGPTGNTYYAHSGDVGRLPIGAHEREDLKLKWVVPKTASEGEYNVSVEVWNEDRVKYLHTVLDSFEKENAFKVGG